MTGHVLNVKKCGSNVFSLLHALGIKVREYILSVTVADSHDVLIPEIDIKMSLRLESCGMPTPILERFDSYCMISVQRK